MYYLGDLLFEKGIQAIVVIPIMNCLFILILYETCREFNNDSENIYIYNKK